MQGPEGKMRFGGAVHKNVNTQNAIRCAMRYDVMRRNMRLEDATRKRFRGEGRSRISEVKTVAAYPQKKVNLQLSQSKLAQKGRRARSTRTGGEIRPCIQTL